MLVSSLLLSWWPNAGAQQLAVHGDKDGSEAALLGCHSPEPAEPSLAAAYQDFAGKTIAQIRYKRIDVFDPANPEEDNSFYQFLNKLHITTRKSVIRQNLLFETGDALDVDAVAESERILRSTHYLGNAQVEVDEVCGDEVALLVTTREVWTTEPRLSLSRRGGENNSSIGFSEGNLLGTGNEVSIIYNDDPERSSIDYSFSSPHLFNTHLSLALLFSDTSDGQTSLFRLRRPFYSLKTRWAAGFENLDRTVVEEILYGGDEVNEYRHKTEYREAFVGWAADWSDRDVNRFLLGFSQEQEEFEPTGETQQTVPDSFDIVYPWLEYQYIENEFAVYENLYQLHRVEDVAMGANLRVRLGYGTEYWGNDSDALRYNIHYRDLLGVGEHHILQFQAELDGRNYSRDNSLNEILLGGQLSYFYLQGRKHRWFASLRLDKGNHLQQHNELTLGGELGLRGYPLDYQRGDKRYLLTLEKRYISDLHIFNLFRVGMLAFIDAGRAWSDDYPDAPHLSNIGVGLRLSSSKARIGHVLHLDLAYPLADKYAVDHYQLHMQASTSF